MWDIILVGPCLAQIRRGSPGYDTVSVLKKKKRHLRIKWSLKRGQEYFLRVCPSGKKSYLFGM